MDHVHSEACPTSAQDQQHHRGQTLAPAEADEEDRNCQRRDRQKGLLFLNALTKRLRWPEQ